MLRKHFGREKQTFLTYEYYYFQMGLMAEYCSDDCADDCTCHNSCRRDMNVVWRWRWAWSGNWNHRWRRCRLCIYYARRLVYHNDIPAATVMIVCHSIMIALWLVAVLSGSHTVHVITAYVASALGIGLATAGGLILAAPCAGLCQDGCRAEHESCHKGKNCSLHHRSVFYEPRLG